MRFVTKIIACVAALIASIAPHSSRACAGIADMGRLRQTQYVAPTEDEVAAALPFMSTEQVLVVFDPQTSVEHLVLEMRFDKVDASFGFVVPIPSTPSEVVKVEHSPFASLRDVYVFTPEPVGLGSGRLLANQGGVGIGASTPIETPSPPAVEILDEHPLGALTAFTLAVHDASELDAWLRDHDFIAPRAINAWADRYARMGFAFVALKHSSDADAGAASAGLTSETMRISFSTPQPFFPYSEIVAPKISKRLLSAWVIAPEASRPIARNVDTFAQPWKSGQRATASHDELALVLKDLAGVIPAGDKLVVQTFRDWKTSREGWGDVIFVPEKIATLDDAAKERRKKLLGVIDSELVPPAVLKRVASDSDAASTSPSAPSIAPSAATSTSSSSRGCSASGADVSSASIVVVLAFFVRRRRVAALAFFSFIACAKTESPKPPQDATPEANASPSTEEASSENAAPAVIDPVRATAAFAILAGDLPDGGIPVIAGTPPIPPAPNAQADLKITNIAVQGALDAAIAKRYITRAVPVLRRCYENGLRGQPDERGNVMVHLFVTPEGTAHVGSVASSIDGSTQSCMRGRFDNMQFPRATAVSDITIRMTLRPPDRR